MSLSKSLLDWETPATSSLLTSLCPSAPLSPSSSSSSSSPSSPPSPSPSPSSSSPSSSSPLIFPLPQAKGEVVHEDNGEIKKGVQLTHSLTKETQPSLFSVEMRNEKQEKGLTECFVCHVVGATKYQCPRCEIQYCSVSCYKQHNESCTESFYESQVKEALKSRASHTEQQRVVQILKRMEETESKTQETFFALEESGGSCLPSIKNLSLGERSGENPQNESSREEEEGEEEEKEEEVSQLFPPHVQKILLSLPTIDAALDYLETLPPELTQRFIAGAKEGKLSHLLDPWVPWWSQTSTMDELLKRGPGGCIEEMESPGDVSLPQKVNEGEIPEVGKIKPFNEVYRSSRPPSPTLIFDLLDILFAYVLMMREVNGDWCSQPLLCVQDILCFSSTLGANGVHSSVEHVFSHKTSLPALSLPQVHVASHDCLSLLKGKRLTVAAIHDLRSLFLQSVSQEPKTQQGAEERENTRKVKLVEKKLNFFLSWVWEQEGQILEKLAIQVMVQEGLLKEQLQAKTKPKSRTRVFLPLKK